MYFRDIESGFVKVKDKAGRFRSVTVKSIHDKAQKTRAMERRRVQLNNRMQDEALSANIVHAS